MTARALAALDVLASSAETSASSFTRPVLHDGDELEIVQGRHPVIEAFIDEPFVPNSIYLNNSTDRLLIITGPNMGGQEHRPAPDCDHLHPRADRMLCSR